MGVLEKYLGHDRSVVLLDRVRHHSWSFNRPRQALWTKQTNSLSSVAVLHDLGLCIYLNSCAGASSLGLLHPADIRNCPRIILGGSIRSLYKSVSVRRRSVQVWLSECARGRAKCSSRHGLHVAAGHRAIHITS